MNNKGIVIGFVILGTIIIVLASYVFISDTSKATYGFRCVLWSVQFGEKLNGSKHNVTLDNEMRQFESECIYSPSIQLEPKLRCLAWSNELLSKGDYFTANINSISNFDRDEFHGALILYKDECDNIK